MKTVRILLVDDAEAFTTNMTRLLSRRGYEVKAVNDGESAIGLIEEEDFDVVILDLKMPGMNGVDTLKELKLRKPNIEVIILTAYDMVDLAVDGIRGGAFDYLTKPVRFEQLHERICQACEKN